MTCYHKNEKHSDGSTICTAGSKLECRGDEWVYIDVCEADGEDISVPIIPPIAVLAGFLRNDAKPETLESFYADPTGFVVERLRRAGVTAPDSFAVFADNSDNHSAKNVFIFKPEKVSLINPPLGNALAWSINICIHIHL